MGSPRVLTRDKPPELRFSGVRNRFLEQMARVAERAAVRYRATPNAKTVLDLYS
jgi:hypothetical protein